MKNIVLGFLLFLCACSARQEPSALAVFHEPTDIRLKQKALLLQKKLSKAQHALTEDERAIERLRSLLCEAELNAIEAKVESFEKKWHTEPHRITQSLRKEVPCLFHEERATLSRIIRGGPDIFRAQVLLDRILQLITQLSDSVPFN
ncbi:MAG: hypothetical protein HW387_584 [Parachlamydiales bacterium]|nr:hypothetical protein [Parachlamydiales bacterium]